MLDAGCGASAHAGALVERGAQVTGIDSSAGLLAIAAQRLAQPLDSQRADFRDLLLARSGTSKDAELLVLRQEVAKPLAAPG